MNYLIFDNDIYYETDGKSGIVPKDKINTVFAGFAKDAYVAVIDTLQKQVAAPEKPLTKKDEVIASSFTGEYVIQSEQIAGNLFQVIAIEKAKINEIYKYFGFENLRLVVPYGVALREFLKVNNLFNQNKRIVFLDYTGNQVLLTIFNNDIFTTPRRLSVAASRVVSELNRSQENYRSQNKTETDIGFLIATNSKEIMDEIVSNGRDSKENIFCFPDAYPALKGLMAGKFSMHYLLPEQFIRLRKLKIVKRRMVSLGMMLGFLAIFLILLLGSLSINRNVFMRLKNLRLDETSQDEVLKRAYRAKYKDILRRREKPDFSYLVSSFIEALPSDCKAESIIIKEVSGNRYRFEAIVSLSTKDKFATGLFLPRLFQRARIENILVKGSPGVRVVLDIF